MITKELAERFALHWCEWNGKEYIGIIQNNLVWFIKTSDSIIWTEPINLRIVSAFEQEVNTGCIQQAGGMIFIEKCPAYVEVVWKDPDEPWGCRVISKAKAPDELTARVEAVCRVIEKMGK